jgi:hypothetical protein
LEYAVAHTLAGDWELLKERAIGERVFGRPPDYDTGQDSIVRVKANEVRRRLAQYYDLHPNAPLRIGLPSGSYVVQFQEAPAPVQLPAEIPVAEPPLERSKPRTRRWILPTSIVTAGVAMAVMLLQHASSQTELFWRAFVDGDHRLMLCTPSPEVYRIYGRGKDALIESLRPRPPGEAREIPPAEVLRRVTVVPEPRLFVGVGDARAMMLLNAFLTAQGAETYVRKGSETTFAELRSAPAVLIGGMSNPWAVDMMKETRFAFARNGFDPGIQDTTTGDFVCVKPGGWESPRKEDCAVITRLINSKTGRPILIAAGLDHYGTLAVGEFLTRPELLEPALRSAAPGWTDKNLQIVFKIEVVRDDVGPPKVVASHVW